MITVLFPSGVMATYNDLTFIQHGDDTTWILCDKNPSEGGKKKVFIQKSAGAVVSFVEPCRVQMPGTTVTGALDMILSACQHSRAIYRWNDLTLLSKLKYELRRFDARKKAWR